MVRSRSFSLTWIHLQGKFGIMAQEEIFTVNCNAEFKGDIWIVHASIRYRDGFPSDTALLGQGYLALLKAIFIAGQEGRKKGATVARVFLDEGRGELVEIGVEGVLGGETLQ